MSCFRYGLICTCFLFFAVSASAADNAPAIQQILPPELPTSVPAVPVLPPSVPAPPAVKPSFVIAPTLVPASPAAKPNAATPSAFTPDLKNATEAVRNLIQNPPSLREAIEQTPKTIPQQFQKAKDQIRNYSEDKTRFNGNNFEMLKWRNSLLFPPDQLNRLYNAARGLTDQSVGAVLVEVKVPRVAPAFFLNSVLYNTPNNWTIWLNSRRIRSGSKFPELEILKVDQDAVEFIWRTEQLDFISPEWEKKIMPVELSPGETPPRFAYQSKDGLIAVDGSRRFVRFVLGPHQTFVSREMRIVEGFVKSTVFETVQRIATAPAGGSSLIQIQTPPVATPIIPKIQNNIPPAASPRQ